MAIPCAQSMIDVGGSGLSVDGSNIYGNPESIAAAKEWKHAYDSIPEWRKEVLQARVHVEQLRNELTAVKDALFTQSDVDEAYAKGKQTGRHEMRSAIMKWMGENV